MNSVRLDPESGRPLPIQYPEERRFWEAAQQSKLVLQSCRDCGNCWYPVGPVCPRCLSGDFVWDVMAGTGTVRGHVVFHKAFMKYFSDRVPYVVGLIELDEGPRLTASIPGIAPNQVDTGLRVIAQFEHVNDEVSLVVFVPVRSRGLSSTAGIDTV